MLWVTLRRGTWAWSFETTQWFQKSFPQKGNQCRQPPCTSPTDPPHPLSESSQLCLQRTKCWLAAGILWGPWILYLCRGFYLLDSPWNVLKWGKTLCCVSPSTQQCRESQRGKPSTSRDVRAWASQVWPICLWLWHRKVYPAVRLPGKSASCMHIYPCLQRDDNPWIVSSTGLDYVNLLIHTIILWRPILDNPHVIH